MMVRLLSMSFAQGDVKQEWMMRPFLGNNNLKDMKTTGVHLARYLYIFIRPHVIEQTGFTTVQ